MPIDQASRYLQENILNISVDNLLENSPHAIVIHNPDTSVRYINPAVETLTGFRREEVIGKKAPYPWWPEEYHPLLLREFQQTMTRGCTRIEQRYQNTKGETIWAETTVVPVIVNGCLAYLVSNLVDITERKRMRDEMEFYVREIIKIQEEERKRIARELHDDTSQSLASLILELDALMHTKEIIPGSILGRLTKLKQHTVDSLNEVRRFSHELRPGVLDQLGLIAALEFLIEESNPRNNVQIKLYVSGNENHLSPEEKLAVFRIAQEALSNIRKHSQATRAEVNVDFSDNRISLTVSDNGKGFHMSETENAKTKGRLGLIGMRERAYLIGGTLSIISAPDQGTIIHMELTKPTLPISEPQPDKSSEPFREH